MTGYSDTPLAKKLGIKSETTAYFLNLPRTIEKVLKPSLSSVKIKARLSSNTDFIHAFMKSSSELKKQFPGFKRNLSKEGTLWVSWPKKTSNLETDLTGDIVRSMGLETGLVDIKVCAVDDDWSGLKFVFRKKDR